MIRVRFRCGHAHEVSGKTAPRCIVCGETRVARTLNAPAPRIKGHGSGPLVQSVALEAMPVSLASVPLRLKPPVKEAL